MKELAEPPDANLSVSITPDVISAAAIWLVDSDTQLEAREEDVFTTRLILTVVAVGVVLSSNVSVSSILSLLTIVPYNLLSIKQLPCACVPAPGGAANVIVGAVVYPLPPTNPLKSTIVAVTTSPLAIVHVTAAATAPPPGLPPETVTAGATVYPEPELVTFT